MGAFVSIAIFHCTNYFVGKKRRVSSDIW